MTGKARQIERNGVLAPTIERPIPQPRADELLLKIHATSLNFHHAHEAVAAMKQQKHFGKIVSRIAEGD